MSTTSWSQVEEYLETARELAHVGTRVPEMKRFRGVKRSLARMAARGVLYFSRVFTQRQSQFNVALHATVQALGEELRRLESQSQAGQDTRRALEEQVRRLEERVRRL